MELQHSRKQLDHAVPLQQPDDEISLSDVLRTLWKGRAFIVFIPLLAMVMAGLVVAAFSLRIEQPTVYFVELRGIENSRYPNGTEFSPRDLVGPAILEELRRRYDLPSDVNLKDAISVNFGHPATTGIHRRFAEELNVRGLTPAEIANINEEYQRQLKAVTESALRIEVNHSLLKTGASEGALIAQALPELWTKHFSENVQIFQNTRLSRLTISPEDENDLQSTANLLNARQHLQIMDDGLGLMSADNRLALLRTDDGQSVQDVRNSLDNFRIVQFQPIMAAQFQAGDVVGSSYLKGLELKLGELRMKMASYEDALQELSKFHEPTGSGMGTDAPVALTSFQIGGSGLSEIVDLARQASLSNFVQQMVHEKQKIALKIAEVESELQTMAQRVKLVTGGDFRERAAEHLAVLKRSYSDLVERAEERMRTQAGRLYSTIAMPYTPGSLPVKRMLMSTIIAGGFAGMFAVIFVLVRSSLRARSAS